MGEITSAFTRDDIATLIESIGDWEMLGNQEFHMMKMVMDAPMPPEDHEAFEVMNQIKDYYRQKERQINEYRMNRQEKAVFLKAKLLLVRRDMDVNSVFEMAVETSKEALLPSIDHIQPTIAATPPVEEPQAKLAMAEFFIRDLGVWQHYQKFLAEQSGPGNDDETVDGPIP